MDPIAETNLNSTVMQYLNVANVAIGEYEDKTPFKQLFDVGQRVLGDKRVGMAVYKDDASSPHAYFTLGMKDKRLQLLAHGKEDIDFEFKSKQSYIEDVVENDEEYIENPALLDWEWLKSRTGLS